MAKVIRGGFEHPPLSAAREADRKPWAVAVLNLSPRPGAVEGNLLAAETAIVETKRTHPDARWFLLPELFTCGYTGLDRVRRYAEDAAEGPSVRRLSALACSLGIYIAYGFPELLPGSGEKVADSANLVGPDGLLFSYRKRHLVRDTGEHRVFEPGEDLPVVEAGGMRVALAICWDLGFPEVVREAATRGAGLILAPAGWRSPYAAQYNLTCASRALDNGVYLASANQIGDYPEANFDARGGVYGPDGGCISESFGKASIGRLDPEAPARWRILYGSTMPPGNHADRDARAESLDPYQVAVEETGEPA